MSQKSQKPQKSRNGSILNFFKPVSQSQPQSQSQSHSQEPKTPSRSVSQRAQSPLPPSSPLSIRSSPIKGAPISAKSLAQRVEIGASDEDGSDDGGFSDDSLEDLSTLLGRARPTTMMAKSNPVNNPYATPRSKRTALELHSSPLGVMPQHKFDLKALAKDALQDDATNASSLRVRSANEMSNKKSSSAQEGLSPTVDALADIVNDQGGHDAHKVLRAVQRAEPGQAQLWYCFFEQDYQAPPTSAIPKRASRGPWQLITHVDPHSREQNLVSGLPLSILRKNGGLPEELFEWMLDEICVQKSILMRQEYCNMIEECADLVHQRLTPYRLQQLLIRLGADEELQNMPAELPVSRPNPAPYEGRDWSCFESFLGLLQRISKHLSTTSVEYAVKALLRMSLDRLFITNITLLGRLEDAARVLMEAIPHPSWDSFCFEACSLLHGNIKTQCIRINAILCLPIDTARCHELRRRLAVAFLFDDPTLAHQHPDSVITVRGVIDRLNGNDFAVGPKTDFAELRASIMLLDVCVDDGSFSASNDAEYETQFNKDVDELAHNLREVWRKINDSGMKLARTEAKSVIEWVQQRLVYSVRTKRRVKKSVFDLPGENTDPFLPRQQDFMKKYLKKTSDGN